MQLYKGQISIGGDVSIMVPVTGNYTADPVYGSTNPNYTVGGVTRADNQIIGIYITNSSMPVTNTANVTNMTSDTHNITLANGENLSYTGNANGVNRSIGIYANYSGNLTPNGTVPNPGYLYAQNGGSIIMGGRESIGMYNKASNVLLKNTNIEAHNGAIAIVTDRISNVGTTVIQDSTLTAGTGSLLFYNNGGKVDFQGTNTATIQSGGTALYGKGSASLADFSNLNNLTLKMEAGSTILLLDTPSSNISLSTLPTVSGLNIDPSSSQDYSVFKQYKGNFIIDMNSNLDDPNDLYGNVSLVATQTTLNNGISINGSGESQVGIITSANGTIVNNTTVAAINNGTISLTGNKSVGLYSDFGTSRNNSSGVINATGDNGIGIFAENSSLAVNDGNIKIGNSGIGIYGVAYQDLNNMQSFGSGPLTVTNTGTISTDAGSKAVGIYINNNKPSGTNADSILNLGGTVDVSNSVNGIGVYVNNTQVNGGGTLTVGTNGVGMYAKDSSINLSGLNLNLYGDNALGFYLDGNTNFNASGNIDITGTNVVLFNVLSSGTFTNNLTVSAAVGSTYTVGNVNNGNFLYNGSVDLASNGSLITGTNSAVLLDTLSNISSTGSNVIGVALDGQGTPSGSWGTLADATNRGKINLANDSVGMYGMNGVRLENDNGAEIKTGNNSLGLYTEGSGSYGLNNGLISIGENSQGIYVKNSTNYAENSANGVIESNGANSIGIVSDSTGTTIINNYGTINLSGNKSVGIYTTGLGETITNTGNITLGDSINSNDPAIGIFTDNSLINNTGNLSVGKNSVGIYNGTGITNQSGNMSVRENGTGIYTTGGTVNLNNTAVLNLGDSSTVAVYAKDFSTIVNNAVINTKAGNYVFVLNNGSNLTNNSQISLDGNSVFVYSDGGGTVLNSVGADLIMNNSGNVGIYSVNGGNITNNANIIGTGESNIGIYNNSGSITNTGNIKVGDSVLVKKSDGTVDIENSRYSVGIYGENSVISNAGAIEVGENGIGIYTKNNIVPAVNTGSITSSAKGAIGLFAENGIINNSGSITLNGDDSMGIVLNSSAKLVNTGIITMNGSNSVGIQANASTIDNTGTIYINNDNSSGIQLLGKTSILNQGNIIIANGTIGSVIQSQGGTVYPIPSIINAGVIDVSENFNLSGLDVSIKVDPNTITKPTDPSDMGAAFVSDAVKFKAPSFVFGNDVIGILSDFSQGTNASVYKLKDVFIKGSTVNSGMISVLSKSLTWAATPEINSSGNIDIWLTKIPYDDFTSGLWYEDFGKALDEKYNGATGKAGEIFDKLDMIETESDFRKTMKTLSGDIYANMNQREETIANIFEDSLNILKNSGNNTKENVKISIIGGKGKLTEDTDGVVGYDYDTAGVIALREVERTYKHKFGYSLGYTHTNFDFKDELKSQEKSDIIQLGLHSNYKSNNWILENDLMGRVSMHEVERSIEWANSGKSDLTGNYEAYSITSDNRLGKELALNDVFTLVPYGGIKATYLTRPTFSEDGLESLEVNGNDAWSVKPRVGMELKGSVPVGNKEAWKLKGSLDIAYEHELANLNVRESARLTAIEDNHHDLSKPEKEKGTFRTKASMGFELNEKYGAFLSGEYSVGDGDQDDYRVGVNLKAAF